MTETTPTIAFVALVSGGKDSCYAMHRMVDDGHRLVAIANLIPPCKGETDSYMYQSVGQSAVPLYAETIGVPCYQRIIRGLPLNQDMDYLPQKGDEVEDLYELLKEVASKENFEGVCCGAIHSNYQRIRAENVCARLNLKLVSPLWGREQTELLQEMIAYPIDSILIKVAAIGLEPNKHLNKTIAEMIDHLKKLNQKFGINVCGEGGEYETLTLDCPMFRKKIVIDEFRIVNHGNDLQVGYVELIGVHLEEKQVA